MAKGSQTSGGGANTPKVFSCPPRRPPGCVPHAFQDKRYGTNKRLHNQKPNGQYTCTVCGNVVSDNAPKKKADGGDNAGKGKK